MLVFSQRSIGYLNLKTRQFNILRVNARGGNLAVMAAFGQVSYLSGIDGRHFVIYDRQNNFTLCQRVEEGEDGKPAILEKCFESAENYCTSRSIYLGLMMKYQQKIFDLR